MEVRSLSLGDLVAYRALHRFALTEAPHAFVEDAAQDAARPNSEVAALMARGEAWGVFHNGRLVGKLVMDGLPYAPLAHTRWLHGIYLHPDARGSGAGAALLRSAIAHAQAQGVFRVLLWVNAENVAARGFYERMGFREVGRIDQGLSFAGGYVDDVLMCLASEAPALDGPVAGS